MRTAAKLRPSVLIGSGAFSMGCQSYVSTTTAEDAQAAIDAAASATAAAAAAAATEAARLDAIKLNARQSTLMTALTTRNDTSLIAAVAAQYPSLTGDALKAVTDIALVLAVLDKR
jgi:hypothetical protein